MAAGGGRPFPKQKAGNGDGQGDARHLDEKSEFRGKIEKKNPIQVPCFLGRQPRGLGGWLNIIKCGPIPPIPVLLCRQPRRLLSGILSRRGEFLATDNSLLLNYLLKYSAYLALFDLSQGLGLLHTIKCIS